MRRVVSLYLPTWPTDRLRRKLGASAQSADTPIVLFGRQGRRREVLALDAAARNAGLRVSMPASKAQVLVPGLVNLELDPAEDAAALDRLALWALRYAPIVAADPDGLVIDTSGADHLHGGEAVMLTNLVDRMVASGFAARAAVADAWGTAHAAARFLARPVAIIPPGQAAPAMRNLSIRALHLPPPIVDGLHVLGFERIGDIEDTPKAPLTHRFGPELVRRLDQAMVRAAGPFEPVRSPELIEVRRAFGEPIGAAETIARYTGKLVDQLCAALEQQGLGARRLDLLFYRVDNRLEAIRVGTAAPVREARRLTRLLTDRIETIDPGFGIELMTLTATLAEPLRDRQTISSLVEPEEPDISDLIDVIANRLGSSRLYRFAPVESDVPERSVKRVAPTAPDDGASWPGEWPRPSRLLSPPEPIDTMALLPDNPPVWFTWRGIRRRVARADGPERIFGEWWLRDAETTSVRDYFRIEDEGGERFWIYRAGDGEDPATGSHMVPARDLRMSSPRYAELQITSHFSFLRGASSCDELSAQAALLGIEALAVIDRNSLAGVVLAHEAEKTTGVQLVVGCRLDFADGMSLLVYPKDRAAYGRLCRLLSLGKSRGGKGLCDLGWADVVAYGGGLIAVLLPESRVHRHADPEPGRARPCEFGKPVAIAHQPIARAIVFVSRRGSEEVALTSDGSGGMKPVVKLARDDPPPVSIRPSSCLRRPATLSGTPSGYRRPPLPE